MSTPLPLHGRRAVVSGGTKGGTNSFRTADSAH
jgi:hypothetical protein